MSKIKSEHIELQGYSFDKIEPVNKRMSSDKKYHITLDNSHEVLIMVILMSESL